MPTLGAKLFQSRLYQGRPTAFAGEIERGIGEQRLRHVVIFEDRKQRQRIALVRGARHIVTQPQG